MRLPTKIQRVLAPYEPFDGIHREFDSALSRLFGSDATTNFPGIYPVDVREDADHIYVDAELPGFTREQVDVTLENSTLTITAQREETTEKDKDYLLRERRATRYQRSFTLPPTVDDAKVSAKLDSGVLTVTLTKREEVKPRKISVS